jgi:hypothetical protein
MDYRNVGMTADYGLHDPEPADPYEELVSLRKQAAAILAEAQKMVAYLDRCDLPEDAQDAEYDLSLAVKEYQRMTR